MKIKQLSDKSDKLLARTMPSSQYPRLALRNVLSGKALRELSTPFQKEYSSILPLRMKQPQFPPVSFWNTWQGGHRAPGRGRAGLPRRPRGMHPRVGTAVKFR